MQRSECNDATPEEAQLFQNLCILGLAGPGRQGIVELGRTTFRKPSAKPLEYVLMGAFSSIAGEAKAAKVSPAVWGGARGSKRNKDSPGHHAWRPLACIRECERASPPA
jgi:hypothetical protein